MGFDAKWHQVVFCLLVFIGYLDLCMRDAALHQEEKQGIKGRCVRRTI